MICFATHLTLSLSVSLSFVNTSASMGRGVYIYILLLLLKCGVETSRVNCLITYAKFAAKVVPGRSSSSDLK